jgi:hypothetical protein
MKIKTIYYLFLVLVFSLNCNKKNPTELEKEKINIHPKEGFWSGDTKNSSGLTLKGSFTYKIVNDTITWFKITIPTSVSGIYSLETGAYIQIKESKFSYSNENINLNGEFFTDTTSSGSWDYSGIQGTWNANLTTFNILKSERSVGTAPCGLAWDGTYIWCLDMGKYGTSDRSYRLYKYDTNLNLLNTITLPDTNNWNRGLTYDGKYFYYANSGTSKTSPIYIYKVSLSGQLIDKLLFSHSCTGLAWNGYDFFLSESFDYIKKRNVNFEYISTIKNIFSLGGSSCFDLSYDGSNIWLAYVNSLSSSYANGKIYKISTSGETLEQFPTPSGAPIGLVCVDDYLYLGCSWEPGDQPITGKLYKIKIR